MYLGHELSTPQTLTVHTWIAVHWISDFIYYSIDYKSLEIRNIKLIYNKGLKSKKQLYSRKTVLYSL